MVDNELRQSIRITWKQKVNVADLLKAADLRIAFEGLPAIDDEVLTRAKNIIEHPEHRYG
jgi:hypothetical protein